METSREERMVFLISLAGCIRICYFEVKNPALFPDASMVLVVSNDMSDEEQVRLWEASPLRLGTAKASPTLYDLVTKVEYIFVHVVQARSLLTVPIMARQRGMAFIRYRR